MPNVPYDPVPDVVPSTAQPSNYITTQAQPADFGAAIGQATQGLGQTLDKAGEQTGQTAVSIQTVHNNVAADAAFNQHQTNVNNILYGDPADPSKPGYYSLHGQAALDARPGVLQALEDSRTSIGAGLQNQMQTLAFDEASRRLNMYSTAGVGAHSDQEFNRYATETQTAAIDTKARAVANGYNDDELFQHNLEDAGRAADAKSALNEGGLRGTPAGDALFAHNRAEAAQTLYTARAVAMGNANPAQGLAFVQKNSDQFDAITLHKLTDDFKVGADKQYVAGAINQIMGGPVGASAGGTNTGPIANTTLPPEAQRFLPALSGGEGNYTSPAPAGDTSSSPIGNNRYQFLNATWQGAAPAAGVDVNDHSPSSQDAVAWQHAQDVYKTNTGGNLQADIAAGGNEGKIAAALNKVWPSLPGGSEQNTTQAQFAARMAATAGVIPAAYSPDGTSAAAAPPGSTHDPAPFGAEFARMQQARDQAATLFPNRPDMQRQVVEGVWTQIQQTNVLQAKFEAEQAKATRDAQQASGQGFMKQILTDPASFDPKALGNDTNLTWEQKNDLFNIAQKHLQETAAGHDAQTYGPGFWSAYQQVHSSDPTTKINDPSQLWSRGGPSGDLSMAGIDKLTSEITSSKTPEGASYAETTKSFLASAHVAISGHGMFGGQRDSVGEMNFSRFLPSAFAEMEKERQAGETPGQMMVKGGPLDLLVQHATRTPGQMMKDMMGDNNPDLPGAASATAAAKPAPVDLSTAQGVTAAYKGGYFGQGPAAYDKAAAELQKRGFVKVPAAPPAQPSAATN